MKMLRWRHLWLCAGGAALGAVVMPAGGGVPAGPSVVWVEPGGRRVFVRDRLGDGSLSDPYSLLIKGVNWSPASRGSDPDGAPEAFRAGFAEWAGRDLPLMAQLGANTVRFYHDPGTDGGAREVLDACYRRGIKVMMPVDSPWHQDVANLGNVAAVVAAWKDHPAVLCWVVGNEWDINHYYGSFASLGAAAAFTESAAQLVKSLDAQHPVATVIADPHIPDYGNGGPHHDLDRQTAPFSAGPFTSDLVATGVPSVDIWGVNIYRGPGFTDAFAQWAAISTKPVFVGEFGADSYDHDTAAENQPMQAAFDARLWEELACELAANRAGGIALGGLLFEFNDEWWKTGGPGFHDVSNEVNYGQPDGRNDEEWFGIVDIDRNPKQAFATMQGRFAPAGLLDLPVAAHPVLRVTSMAAAADPSGVTMELAGRVVYSRGGGQFGGRGLNVAVVDAATGVRMKGYAHFDTFYMEGGWGGPHPWFDDLAACLGGLPDGSIVALAIGDEGGFIDPNLVPPAPWKFQAGPETGYQALEALGSTLIRQVGYRGGWAMIAVKGGAVLAETMSSDQAQVSVEAVLDLDPAPNHDLRAALPEGGVAVSGIAFAGSAATLGLQGPDRVVCAIEWSDDLADWHLAQRGIVLGSGGAAWTDDGVFSGGPPAGAPRRFYRVRGVDAVWRP